MVPASLVVWHCKSFKVDWNSNYCIFCLFIPSANSFILLRRNLLWGKTLFPLYSTITLDFPFSQIMWKGSASFWLNHGITKLVADKPTGIKDGTEVHHLLVLLTSLMRWSLCEKYIIWTGTDALVIGNDLCFSRLEDPYTWVSGTQFNTNWQILIKERKRGNEEEYSLKEISVNKSLLQLSLEETCIFYFLHHFAFAVFWSLCGSNSNINGFSFTIHSDGNVFHLFSIVCRPPLHLVIDV